MRGLEKGRYAGPRILAVTCCFVVLAAACTSTPDTTTTSTTVTTTTSATATTQPASGALIVHSGPVELNGLAVPPGTRVDVQPGDRLQAKNGGRATLQLQQQQLQLELFKGSTLRVPDTTKSPVVVPLESGHLQVSVSPGAAQVQLQTADRTLAVEGTSFVVCQAATGTTCLFVIEGSVDWSDPRGDMTYFAGEGTFATADQGPQAARCDVDNTVEQWLARALDGEQTETLTATVDTLSEGSCVEVTKLGRIIVEKVTDPAVAPQRFMFTADYAAFELGDGEQHDSGPIPAGTHSVSEEGAGGWETTAVCSDGSTPDAIGLQGGEIVTCTFTNIQIPSSADLAVTYRVSPDEVAAGQILTYVITVHNHGPSPARNTTVSAALPSDVAPVIPSQRCTFLRCDLGTLNSGSTVMVRLEAEVSDGAVEGTVLTSTATVDSDVSDPNGANNIASARTRVQPAIGLIEIRIDGIKRGKEGDIIEVDFLSVHADLVGARCLAESVETDKGSIHPNNDYIVSSAGTSAVIPDFEAAAGAVVPMAGAITLGESIKVELRLGPDEVSSGGFVITLACTPPGRGRFVDDDDSIFEADIE